MAFHLRSGNMEAPHCTASSMNSSSAAGNRVSYLKTYAMQLPLLSMAGKVLARLLLNRLVPSTAEEHLPESQCGFRANRHTTDMVFVLRQLQEKCREQNMGLYATFVDLTKALDTVSGKGLADPRAPRLPLKVSEHSDPAAWRSTRPDQTLRRPVGALTHLQWRKAG